VVETYSAECNTLIVALTVKKMVLFGLVIQLIFDDEYKSLSCSFVQPPVTSSLSVINILLSILFSDTPSLYVYLLYERPSLTPCKTTTTAAVNNDNNWIFYLLNSEINSGEAKHRVGMESNMVGQAYRRVRQKVFVSVSMNSARPPPWSIGQSSWLQIQVRFPALPDFLRSSGSGPGSTQPREYN
jgi:hypothetical protein